MTRLHLALCASTLNVCLVFAAGCFDEIITNPGATAGSESSGTTTAADTAADTATATSVVTSSTMSPEDGDSDGTSSTGAESSTGGGDDPLDGLCPAAVHECGDESWKIAPCDDCEMLSPIAECVLNELGSVSGGTFTTVRCEPECVRDHYTLRSGGMELMIESKLLDGDDKPVELVGRQMCTRVDLQYFSACVQSYTQECADPATWFTSCVDSELTECPFKIDR